MKKIAVLFLLLILTITSCTQEEEKENIVEVDLDAIKARGKIVALTGYNAYSYFIYRGQPMGYEYELVKKLAKHLDVELEIKVVKSLNKMFTMLNDGEGDIIAFNLTVTKERARRVSFAMHHNTTRQVLVQRKPENWRRMRMEQVEDGLIRNQIELEGRTIHVRHGSAYIDRLENLSDEIGGDINIIEREEDINTEELIRMVAEGEINYTVADENIAKLNQAYYTNIDIETEISLPQKIAWAVRKNSPLLLNEINTWLEKLKKKTVYYVLYNKYYKNRTSYRSRLKSEYFSHTGGKISRYDDLLRDYSNQLNWDWRIIASLIYQESQFNPNAKSWAGAKGLMQLMPSTAAMYGVKNPKDPMQNLRAGIKYLNWLDSYWEDEIADSTERIKFVLASYNIGPGHIVDARNLAEKYDADPNLWYDNVEEFLLKKSKRQYYNDEVVKYGYARGVETVNYVRQVLERFTHYKQFITAEETAIKKVALK